MTNCFENIPEKFGFGCMRLPMRDGEVDCEEFSRMVDHFLEAGFHYFDTAHGYLNGKSETALRRCLTSRYPRDRYVLTNKLSGNFFQEEADIRPLFESQLEACGVEYFDYYLMHAQNANNFKKYKACRAYETAFQLKAEGKIRHVGLSFHDTAQVLDQILTEYSQIEVVQLQFNYIDYEDPGVQSRLCYEVCQKHNKPVIVMEPVKGGKLIMLPPEAKKILDDLHGGSYASYAIRFAASFPQIRMVLSGMGSLEMVRDNCGYMADFKPLTQQEQAAIEKVCQVLRSADLISCTACRYCTEVCPQGIAIPDLFDCLNEKRQWDLTNRPYYNYIVKKSEKKPSDCLKCGLCEDACPQKLPIRTLLEEAAGVFE